LKKYIYLSAEPLVATALAVFSNIYLDIEFIGDYVGLEWLAVNHIYGIVEKALLLYGGFRLLEFVFGAFKLEANKKKLIFKYQENLFLDYYCKNFSALIFIPCGLFTINTR